MRFIDQEQLMSKISDLIPALELATAEVVAELDPARRKVLIRQHQPRWIALRDAMNALSHGKCWYTESSNLGSDDDIDHFRPKLSVAGIKSHPGYYWLAFDWKNYRLSCHHANRPRRAAKHSHTGGKGSRFPLVDETKRAFSADDNWRAEEPMLLDPCDPQDPAMLTFWPNGESALAPQYSQDIVAMRRWRVSRLVLHIDWPDFVDARLQLYNKIARLIERGLREDPIRARQTSEAFKDVVRDLISMMQPQADFATAARVYVEGFSHVWWVKDIVLRAC